MVTASSEFELADALGHRLRRQGLEDLDAERLVELGQRGEVEVVAEEADQRRPFLGVERLQERAEIGLVEFVGIGPERCGVARVDRRPDQRDERLGEIAALIVDGRRVRPSAAFGHGGLVRHAVLRMDWFRRNPAFGLA